MFYSLIYSADFWNIFVEPGFVLGTKNKAMNKTKLSVLIVDTQGSVSQVRKMGFYFYHHLWVISTQDSNLPPL